MLNLAVINESPVVADADVHKMLPAFATQWNTDLKTAWSADYRSDGALASSTICN